MIELITKVATSTEFWSGLGGAIVGGVFTLLGTHIEGNRQERKSIEDAKEKRLNVLIGVKAEMDCLVALYKERMEHAMNNYNGKEPFALQFPVTQNYFTFYEANSLVLSSVKETTLNEIVSLYASSRSLVDSFRGNNAVLEQLVMSRKIYEETRRPEHKFQFEQEYMIAVDYGQGLQGIHEQTMDKYKTCMAAISKEINELRNAK